MDERSRREPRLKLVSRPASRGEAAKEFLVDAALNAKAVLGEFVEDFQSRDRFFKYKAGVVAGWTLLSALSLFLACPGAPGEGDSNDLDAKVNVQEVMGGEKAITAIYIGNQGTADWGDTFVRLNNVYTAALPDVKAGTHVVLTVTKFSSSDGRTPPPEMKPQRIDIRCKAGEASFDLTGRAR
jgi:phage tail protein X